LAPIPDRKPLGIKGGAGGVTLMKEKNWHRRRAIILASQLPKGKEDALLILEAATRLVSLPGFWDGEPAQKPASVVKLIGGNECA
jgi:hypothetical protein